MPPRFTLVCFTSVMLSLGGCSTLKEKLTEEEADPAGSTTGPAATQPQLAGLEPGWELAPPARYSATQSADEVTIRATGEHPSAGYEAKLVQSMLRIWPPQYLLAIKKPDGPAATVMTPFDVTASFKAKEPVSSVSVRDAQGLHEVPVEKLATP